MPYVKAPPLRIHLAEDGKRHALCGSTSARRTADIRKVTCKLCREIHRQQQNPQGRLWAARLP